MIRVLTALFLIPLVFGIVFFAPPPAVWGTLALVALLCLREFFDLAGKQGFQPLRVLGHGASVLLIVLPGLPQLAFVVAVGVFSLILALQQASELRNVFGSVASTLFGLIYIAAPFALARELHLSDPHWLFFVLVASWVGDSGAYFVGRAMGRRKLAPRISPGKTWEGAIASVILTVLVGAGYLLYFRPSGIGPMEAVLLAFAVNVSGQFADLAESAIKRGAGVKDSGALLPGHGGMLDRVDTLLFSIPTAYFCLLWIR
jgi:phosphatidate cytidylyltransferase